jgi:hypothetical protein
MVDQMEMNRNYLVGKWTQHDQVNIIKSHALIDCGVTSVAFIDKDHA